MRRLLFALLSLLVLATQVRAEVQVGVTVGWQGPYRSGKWTPIYVTATESRPREVLIELYAPTDNSFAMRIHQVAPISQSPRTTPLYVPLTYTLEGASITVYDNDSLKRLAVVELSDSSPVAVSPEHLLVGISGNDSTHRLLEGQLRQTNIIPGFLPQSYLPSVPVGYDMLDVLMLNEPNFNRLDVDQQRSILQWVRGGGNLVIIPGTDPLPDRGPLLELLPIKLGATTTFNLPLKARLDAGLAERFKTIKGRAVSAVADGVTTTKLFSEGDVVGYRQWLGFGQVMVIPADVSSFVFNDSEMGRTFWSKALAGMVDVPPAPDENNRYGSYQEDPRQTRSVEQALNWAGDVPGAGQFGFSYLAMALLAMMFVVGPLDWFVLKKLGRQPWTWVTTTGWIGLVTVAAIYVGNIFKSGDLHFRSITLMDEADGMRVAQTSLAGIYAPKTKVYDIEFQPDSWWRPASEGMYYRSQGLLRRIDSHQDYRGNRPVNMLINVWNLRFLEGTDATPVGAVIGAKLTRRGDEISGSITNNGPFPLTQVAIRTSDGPLRLPGRIEPGATAPISGKIDRRDSGFNQTTPAPGNRWRGHPGELPSTRPSLPTAGDIAVERTDRIDQILRQRKDVACLYAEFEPDKSPGVKINEPDVRNAHFGMIRALVPTPPPSSSPASSPEPK